MPRLTRWFAKTSLAYFVAALLAALLLALDEVASLPALVGALRPVYFHLFLVGWVTQLIFGVMHWMFPRASHEQPRGREWLIWGVYFTLNVGLLLRALAEPLLTLASPGPWGELLAVSAVLQWLAGLTFVANTWPRVKVR